MMATLRTLKLTAREREALETSRDHDGPALCPRASPLLLRDEVESTRKLKLTSWKIDAHM